MTGTELLLAGRIREAIAVLRDEPPAHAHWHNLAVALRAAGSLDEARACARRAEELAPACAPTLALVGSLQRLAGDDAGALATFQRAVACDPDHAVSRYYLAIGLAARGSRAEAVAELRTVVATSSGVPALVRERLHAQLAELEADGRIDADLCSVPLVSELIAERPTIDGEHAVARRGPGRSIELAEAKAIVDGARRIVALTGAGISSASGLATRKELWQRHDRDSAVSIWKFRSDPLPLWTVIREFLGTAPLAPNAAHRALAALPNLVAVITQNVEGLHQAAGTRCPTIELHGTLLETRCDACGARPGRACAELLAGALPPPCPCGAALRPDVVLFGEWVDRDRLARAAQLCATCDVLLVVGTAADVAPAADLPLLALSRGATVVELKRQPSRLVRSGALHLAGTAEDVLPRLL